MGILVSAYLPRRFPTWTCGYHLAARRKRRRRRRINPRLCTGTVSQVEGRNGKNSHPFLFFRFLFLSLLPLYISSSPFLFSPPSLPVSFSKNPRLNDEQFVEKEKEDCSARNRRHRWTWPRGKGSWIGLRWQMTLFASHLGRGDDTRKRDAN